MNGSPCLWLNQFPSDAPESFQYKAFESPKEKNMCLKILLFFFLWTDYIKMSGDEDSESQRKIFNSKSAETTGYTTLVN